MSTSQAAQLYETHIKPLPAKEQLELLALIAQALATEGMAPAAKPRHSLLELDGLGKEIWEGIDAQEYVNALRDEWDERPT